MKESDKKIIIAIFGILSFLSLGIPVLAISHPCREPCSYTRESLLRWGVPQSHVEWTLQKGEQVAMLNGTVISLDKALELEKAREKRVLEKWNHYKTIGLVK